MECKACERIKEKKNSVYEDEDIVIFIESVPCIPGHVKIFTKKHAESLKDISKEETNKLFRSASAVSSIVFDSLKVHGTNIICNEGIEEHLCVHVIPRKAEDGIDFKWNAKQIEPDEMDKAFEKLKDKAFFIGKEKKKAERLIDEDKKAEEIEKFVEQEEDYMIKHIRRIP